MQDKRWKGKCSSTGIEKKGRKQHGENICALRESNITQEL
jgi:hypothetical protein